ncbi:hypothetical protein VPH35_093234 [Triticum aestivum]
MTLADIKSTRGSMRVSAIPYFSPLISISDLSGGRALGVGGEHGANGVGRALGVGGSHRGGDEAKMEMRRVSRRVVEQASEEERSRISGKAPLEILYWAVMEAESGDPMRREQWYRYLPYKWVSSDPIWDSVRVVTMAERSPPRSPAMPVVTDNDVRVLPRQNVAQVVSQLPRRSPRFPRRSARIQSLAQSVADG